ncbi:transcriptional regulator GcvA [Pedomonas sp. V897]|uniref:transcriptional regulator GcvA n=1 Tax=Pedomonas sp. V897 TaxID=3446482 RepID=UPI003EDFE894
MKRTHLPLNALRVFDAAARHLSFTKAADELAVTPAAVGQHIRALEDLLGVILFKRLGRNLALTPEAERALPALRDGFLKFEEAVRTLQAAQTSKSITISVPPSFAAKWLVPRIERFAESHPDMQVRIFAAMQLVDFSQENIDLAIRFGRGDYPDLVVEKLLDEHVYPACAPSLLERFPIRTAADLVNLPLIHDEAADMDDGCPTWPMWLKAAGVDHPDPERGIHFNQSSLAIEAATAGKGVVLAKAAIAAADIEAGRLVRLFNSSHAVEFGYYLVAPEPQWRQKKVQTFVNWVKAEAARHQA